MTDVTVVIPTRDRPALLAQAIHSALGQQGVSIDVVVVDDGSAADLGQAFGAIGDEHVTVVRNNRAHGPGHARNRGIAAAQSEWIAFLDDDDLWSPEKLVKQLESARAANASFVYGRAVMFDQHRQVVWADVPPPSPQELPAGMVERNTMPAGSSNIVASAALIERVGGFDEQLSQLADWDMWLRIAAAGRAAVCPEVVVGCRRHSGNMLLTDRDDVWKEFAHLAAKHRALGDEHGLAFDPVAFAHWVASAQRRAGRRMAAAATHLRAAAAYRSPGHLGCALRVPIGDWAMDLRQPAPREEKPPEWLRPYLGW